MVSIGDEPPAHRAPPATCRSCLRPGRPRRGQHVGDRCRPRSTPSHAGRRRRRRPPLHRAADRRCGWSSSAARGRRHDARPTTATTPARTLRLAGGGTVRRARPDARVGAAVGRHARPARTGCSTTCAATAGRSATATCPSLADRRPTRTSYAREPGSAEMPSAGRPFTAEVITDLVAHGVGVAPARAAHRRGLAGGPRAAVPRAVPGARCRRPGWSTPPTPPAAGSSPSAPPWCGRSRRRPTTTASSTPVDGWTDLVDHARARRARRRRAAHRVARAGGAATC